MKINRRYFFITGNIAICVCVALAVLAMMPTRVGVTKANFDRIKDGMKVEEVEQILGGSGLLFDAFADRQIRPELMIDHGGEPRLWFIWSHEDGSIAFVEVIDDSVMSKEWQPSTETVFDKLRRWLHLPK